MKNLKIFIFTLIGFFFLGATRVNAADLESIADEVAPNGIYSVNTIAPTTFEEYDFYMEFDRLSQTLDYSDQNISYSINPLTCNDTYTTCDLEIRQQGAEDPVPVDEYSRTVTVTWKPTNQVVKNRINSYIEAVMDLKDLQGLDEYGYPMPLLFDLTDLNLINYYVNSNTPGLDANNINKMFNYSEQLKKLFNNANLTYTVDFRAGDGNPALFGSYSFGGLIFKYNGIPHGAANGVGVRIVEAIYVPSDTSLTDEALIAAANNRIKSYLPNSNITITVGQAFDTYTDEEGNPIDLSQTIDISKTAGNTYIVNFGTFSTPFVIIADSSKISNPKFKTNDLDTNVSIASDVTSIPLDALISVDELDKEGEEYQRLLQLIGAEKMTSYDLALFSETKNGNITKLDNGKFLISIPVPTELEGKKLIVYYVNAKNEKEAHDVTIKDGYASFEADHFSIYNLTEKTEEENPQTFDEITSYIIIGMISLIGLTGTVLYINNKRFN